MKATQANVDKCIELIDGTLPTFALSLALGEMSEITYLLASESLTGCRELILALQAKIEELEADL